MAERNYYDVLGVSRDATEEQVKGAYRRLALALHPDVNKRATAEAEFQELQEAFHTLSDVSKKLEYDAALRRKTIKGAPRDEIDAALEMFDIESEVKPKKRKKRAPKKPKSAKAAVELDGHADRFEPLPDGFDAGERIF